MNRNDMLHLSQKRLRIHVRRVLHAYHEGYGVQRAIAGVTRRHKLTAKQGAIVLLAVVRRLRNARTPIHR